MWDAVWVGGAGDQGYEGYCENLCSISVERRVVGVKEIKREEGRTNEKGFGKAAATCLSALTSSIVTGRNVSSLKGPGLLK